MQVVHKWELQLLLLLLTSPLFLLINLIRHIDFFDFKRLFKYCSLRLVYVRLVLKLCWFFNYIFSFDQHRFIKHPGRLLLERWWLIILEVKSGHYLCSDHCRCCNEGCSFLNSSTYCYYIGIYWWRIGDIILITTTLWKLFHWNDGTHLKWRILFIGWTYFTTTTTVWLPRFWKFRLKDYGLRASMLLLLCQRHLGLNTVL